MLGAMSGVSTEPEPFSLRTRVGRLIEARVFALRTAADADAYTAALVTETKRIPLTVAPVLLADHRPVAIYPRAVADRLIELFLRMNSRLERVAIIASPTNATMVMQLQRLVREARDDKRKVTYAPAEAASHLREVLDGTELARVQAFLAEWKPS